MGKDKRNTWQNIKHNSVTTKEAPASSNQASSFRHSSTSESAAAAIAARRAEMNRNAQIGIKAQMEKKNGTR